MKKTTLILACLILNLYHLNGQIGTRFWFAAPDVSWDHAQDSKPLNLHITAVYNTHVIISRPADPGFTPIEFDLNQQQTQTIQLDAILAVTDIEVYARDRFAGNFLQNKGFLIQSDPGEITAYYELAGNPNTDIIALKAANALGKDFWVSTQRKYKNHGYSDDYSGFVVVATQDGTTVSINPNGNNLAYSGTTAYNVTLNKGQSFAVRAAGQAPAQHIFGIRVTSNKNITIIIFDDSMQIDDGGGNWDIFADQIVPTSLVGIEYIVLHGWVWDRVTSTKDGEAIFITPTQDGTFIEIDGVPVAGPLAAGSYFEYTITKTVPPLVTYVWASKPVYVNHISGYSTQPLITNAARELGGAILPPIDKCTGSHSVTVKRTPAPGFVFFNNLVVRNDTAASSPNRNQAIHNFTYSIDGGPPQVIPASHFTYIMDSAFAIYDRTKAGGAAYYNSVSDGQILRVENPIARFHLGVMQAIQSPGCKYGYFSDYAASDASAGVGGYTLGPSDYVCSLNPVQLVANGGIWYKWGGTFDPLLVNKLDFDDIPAPYFFPDSAGVYYFYVLLGGECQTQDSINIEVIVGEEYASNFSFSADVGCSPFTTNLTNLSDTNAPIQIWNIIPAVGSAYELNQDTLPLTFPLTLPENYTDSIQTHTVKLIVKGPSNSCPTNKTKEIKVKPYIKANFGAFDTIGCQPLLVNFSDSSYGNLDTINGFLWDFGDNSQTFDRSTSHVYNNYGLDDTTFISKLVVTSPFDCMDSLTQNIVVHPRVHTAMAIETAVSCSPLDIVIDPGNSKGVDTFFWHVQSPTADTIYETTNDNPVTLYHQDITYSSPDTIYVNLMGMNRMGCTDSFPQQNIVVFPEVNALFEIPNDTICDGDSINFINNSQGFQLFYNWDFDDGSIYQDTTGSDYTHAFFNRSDADSAFRVTLTATSAYFCESKFDTVIIVHPYVKANFSLGYETNCTPILSTFSNYSTRGHNFEWDFGDGTNSTTAAPTFTHQYWNPDPDNDTTYTIQLVAHNNEGCSDTAYHSLDIYPHVVAAFGISDSVGCSPLNVSITNSSTGGLLTYVWDFGNNRISTNPSPPPITYTNITANDTSYIISLTAFSPNGCDSTTFDTVSVFAFIDANFYLLPADSCSPFILHPDNLSSAGANIFEWDLINSGLPTDNNVIPDFGTLTNNSITTDTLFLRLIAYGANDPEHLACADRDSVMVLVYPELDVDFTLDDGLASCQPYISTITNNTNIPSGNAFQWFIDDIYYSSARDPLPLNIPNYEDTDVDHVIRLSGQSMHGCRDTAWQTVTVYSLVDAHFTVNKSGICSADSFEIDRRASRGGIVEYEWDFAGDIQIRDDSIFNYSFENTASSVPLTRQITLTIRNSHDCTSDISNIIDVYPEVRADFAIDDSTVCYPYLTTFANTTENASIFYWDFGDGTGSNNSTPVPHVFANFDNTTDETYTINMLARSPYNCYDSIMRGITVYAKPDAEFYFPVSVDCPPFEASMVNESEGYNLAYLWDFGDGTTSLLENPDHTFSNPGTTIIDIPITLEVTSGRSCMDTVVRVLNVYPDVVVNFTASDNEGCSPLTVNFNGQASNVSNMIWYIDGLAFSTLEDPSYRFVNNTPSTRDYDITFSAHSIYGCGDDTTKTITIYSSPTAEFIPEPRQQDYNTEDDQTLVTFSNETLFQNNWSYYWDFGDGNTGDNSEASFNYYYGDHFWGPVDENGKIPVYLIAWNDEYPECHDTVQYDIYIRAPLPEIALEEDVSGCVPLTIDFSATVDYAYEDDFEWNFGIPGEVSNVPEPSYTYTEPGYYTVMLVVRGDGGTNWDSRFIRVNPKPDIHFTFNDSVVFVMSQNHPDEIINFYNQTTFGQDYYWGFNLPVYDYNEVPNYVDTALVAYSLDKDPSWYYDETGMYYVFLIAQSDQGCYDTLINPVPINVLGEGRLQFPTGFFVNPSAPRDGNITDPRDPDVNIFRAYGEGVEKFKLEVYNRWGVLVFESNDINYGWNGFIDGKAAKQDVYVWRARGRFTNGEPFVMSGDVALIIGDPY